MKLYPVTSNPTLYATKYEVSDSGKIIVEMKDVYAQSPDGTHNLPFIKDPIAERYYNDHSNGKDLSIEDREALLRDAKIFSEGYRTAGFTAPELLEVMNLDSKKSLSEWIVNKGSIEVHDEPYQEDGKLFYKPVLKFETVKEL